MFPLPSEHVSLFKLSNFTMVPVSWVRFSVSDGSDSLIALIWSIRARRNITKIILNTDYFQGLLIFQY